MLGAGKLEALPGAGSVSGGGGGGGIIRLEGTNNASLILNPTTQAVAVSQPVIFQTNATIVTVQKVQNIDVLPDPKAAMNSSVAADDITLVTTNNVTIQLQTQNFPTNGIVTVYIKPRNGTASPATRTATFVNGNTNSALWQVTNVALPYPAHTVIQARASF